MAPRIGYPRSLQHFLRPRCPPVKQTVLKSLKGSINSIPSASGSAAMERKPLQARTVCARLTVGIIIYEYITDEEQILSPTVEASRHPNTMSMLISTPC